MDNPLVGFAAVAALVLANGFFVATEFAIVAVRTSRLEQLAAQGNASARAARAVVGRLDTFIAACQLGITMASLALGWIGEPAFAHIIEPLLEPVVGAFAETAAHSVAVGVSFALITALHIVIGELAPKGVALQRPEATALAVARPMQIFERVFRLPIQLLNGVGNSVLRLFGLEPARGHSTTHSVDELRVLVGGMQRAGIVDDVEARIAGRAFRFGEVTVGELQTPRTEIDGVPRDASLDAAIEVALRNGHSRLVVFDGSIDNIVGVVHLRDMLRARSAAAGSPVRGVSAVLRSVLVTPATRPADALFEEMRTLRRHLAVVLDEYGSTSGIVTLENLFEALVGRIPAEDEAFAAQATVVASLDDGKLTAGDGSLVLEGLTRLDELEELANVRIAPTRRSEVDTVGGLVMAELGRLPSVGDEVSIGGRRLRVESLDGRRINAVRLIA
jgi:CBS domain containing-hemolysin-like protein